MSRLAMSRLAVSLLLAAACAGAQEPRSTAPQGAPPSAAAADDEQVCHEERATGSNLSRTVCRSKSDIRRDRDDAQQFNARSGRMMQTKQGD
jgi:predicted outer membrane protein